jgi:hypothetical protein
VTLGTCKTNTKQESVHRQPVSLKEYLICIYYHKPSKNDDRAFERASKHCLSQLKLKNCGDNFIFKEYQVTSGQDFKKIWSTIFAELNKNIAKVKDMHVFSHSSKTGGQNDGLEFLSTRDERSEVLEDGTISYSEISELEKLRWSPNANLVLHGCNTGLRGTSVQSIADVFAIRQEKCRVHGQKGWAYFSKDESVYKRTSPADKEIYLWAFSRGNNSYIGNVIGGEKIPALIVEKKK